MKIKIQIICILLFSVSLNAQNKNLTEIDKLKSENLELKNKLEVCQGSGAKTETKTTNTNNDLEVKTISVIGNKKSQIVTIEFTFKHNLSNKQVQIHDREGAPTAYDEDGNTYLYNSIDFVNSKNGWNGCVNVDLPTGINIKGKVSFKGILPSVSIFKLAKINYYFVSTTDYDQKTEIIEFNDLKIIWK
jgi:hypothetical protein